MTGTPGEDQVNGSQLFRKSGTFLKQLASVNLILVGQADRTWLLSILTTMEEVPPRANGRGTLWI